MPGDINISKIAGSKQRPTITGSPAQTEKEKWDEVKAVYEHAEDSLYKIVDSLKKYENRVYSSFKDQMDDSTYARSVAYGEQVAKVILKRATTDNYLQTRGKPRFLGSSDPGKWHPTPPDYLDGVEYCWGTMRTFVLNSSSQFAPPPPPVFSTDKNSIYFYFL